MLSKKQRLEKSSFSFVFRSGKVKNTANFLVKIAKLPDGKSRYAVAVSKKTAKTAVSRNKIRRMVYDAIKQIIPKTKDQSVVFVVKKDITTLSRAEVVKEITPILEAPHS